MANRFVRRPDGTTGSIPHDVLIDVPISSGSVDMWAFVADTHYEVVAIREIHTVAGTDAGSVTLDVKKASGTTAPASGTTVLSSTFNLKSTANTLVTKDAASGLTATVADRKLTTGDRLGVDLTGTLTAVAGGLLQIHLRRLQSAGGSR